MNDFLDCTSWHQKLTCMEMNISPATLILPLVHLVLDAIFQSTNHEAAEQNQAFAEMLKRSTTMPWIVADL